MAKPFVKWAGGKGRQAEEIAAAFPRKFGRYFEPFVGGGALFFHLEAAGRLRHGAVLSDTCAPLVGAYEELRDSPSRLIDRLSCLERAYKKAPVRPITDADSRADFYATVRAKFNRRPTPAMFMFLNKTCFNGLWRVSGSGKFNVPHGAYANPNVCDVAALFAAHGALLGCELNAFDFEVVFIHARRGDLVYCDPPYWPLGATANFTGYTAGGFDRTDQERLAVAAGALKRAGVHVALSNHDLPEVRKLYRAQGFKLRKRTAARSINVDGAKRGRVAELLITSWS